MFDFDVVMTVILMFFSRIGLPVLLLVLLGAIIGRWQERRAAETSETIQELKPIRDR